VNRWRRLDVDRLTVHDREKTLPVGTGACFQFRPKRRIAQLRHALDDAVVHDCDQSVESLGILRGSAELVEPLLLSAVIALDHGPPPTSKTSLTRGYNASQRLRRGIATRHIRTDIMWLIGKTVNWANWNPPAA
jgi:hypothetical protein